MINRRKVLALLAASSASLTAGGCSLLRRPLMPLCPEPITPGETLTVDVHAHMFNGTDLPIKSYLELVAANNSPTYGNLVKSFGGILSAASWAVAPNAKMEREALADISADIQNCQHLVATQSAQASRQKAYSIARAELKAAVQRRLTLRRKSSPDFLLSFPLEDEGAEIIEALPSTYEAFRTSGGSPQQIEVFKAFAKTAGSAIDFVLEMFQYRYTSYVRYLDDFEQSSGRRVDLTLSALVDYDWWLNAGRPTETSIADQVDLMSELAMVTSGRLHYWVPFCPYREAQYRLHPETTFSSLKLAQQAVREKGAIGVKIYPPMGFAPLGNQDLPSTLWQSVAWLSGLAKTSQFGAQLDISLRELYKWCVQEDVPILAHSNTSSGPSTNFSNLAGPNHWQPAIDEFRELRVIFGHFGGAEDTASAANARHFIRLMGSNSGGAGRNTSADVSYFAKAIDDQPGLEAALSALLLSAADPNDVLPKRLLFGSDWKMLLLEAHADQYLKDFDTVFETLAKSPPGGLDLRDLVTDALGRNAIAALGLHVGGKSRRRIDDFYAAHQIAEPQWMRSTDT
jgi:predicted TIM-barrel fold metal-dependent hydrolase